MNVTVAVVLENEAVLKRDCHQSGLTEKDVDDLADAVSSQAWSHLVFPLATRSVRS
jgi:hypothetical protein